MKQADLNEFLSSSQREKLDIYVEELCHFNQTIPLYSRRQGEDFCWELILDSILAGRLLLKDCTYRLIADIGSGAGFPGIVLATLDPFRQFWLFEPNRKKAAFLEYACWKMKLENVQVKNVPVQQRKIFLNCAVSKAFLSLSQRLLLTQPCFKTGASYYHLQSLGWEKQWQKLSLDVQNAWRIITVKKYSHPCFFSERFLLRVDLRSN